MFKNRCSFPLINLSCLHLMSLWLLQFIHPFTYTTCKSYYSPTIALCHLKFTSSDLTIASCLGVCGHLLVSPANIILACDQNIDWMIHCLLRRAPLCFCLPVQSITACCSVLQFCQCVCLRSQDRKEINRIHLWCLHIFKMRLLSVCPPLFYISSFSLLLLISSFIF